LELIDFVEPRLMNRDIHQFLFSAVVAVDATISRLGKVGRDVANSDS
jgi:hypothetical protein